MASQIQNVQLSPHFKLYEFTNTNQGIEYIEANRAFGIQKLDVLKDLCNSILEPLRAHVKEKYNIPYISISSGLRSPELNKKVGGTPTSQHSHAEAADLILTPDRSKLMQIFEDIEAGRVKGLDMDKIAQVIIERKFSSKWKTWGAWIHVGVMTDRFVAARQASGRNTKGKEFLLSLDGKAIIAANEYNRKAYIEN